MAGKQSLGLKGVCLKTLPCGRFQRAQVFCVWTVLVKQYLSIYHSHSLMRVPQGTLTHDSSSL